MIPQFIMETRFRLDNSELTVVVFIDVEIYMFVSLHVKDLGMERVSKVQFDDEICTFL